MKESASVFDSSTLTSIRYAACPNCKKKKLFRIIRGSGEIEITCRSCRKRVVVPFGDVTDKNDDK